MVPAAHGEAEITKSATDKLLFAKNVAWDDLVAGSERPICCEWVLEMANPPEAIDALVFAEGFEHPVGRALVQSTKDSIRILINEYHVPEDAEPVTDPEDLRIVLMVSENR